MAYDRRDRVDFRLLGPLEVVAGDEPVSLGGPKQRALLALLLLRANEVVPRELAIDTIWGDEPPGQAVNGLQVYVHGLRKALGRERIEQRGAGYAIAVARDAVDVQRFERLLSQGEAALVAGDAATAAQRLADARALWRG